MNNSPGHDQISDSDKQKIVLLYILLFFIAFVPRLLHLLLIRDNPFFQYPIIDCQTNDELAQKIAAGRWPGNEVFWQAPLYPYFLRMIYSVFGRDLFLVRFVQILLGSANCLLLYKIAKMAFNSKVAFISFLMAALYGPFLFFDAELLNPVLVIFLNLIVVSILLSFYGEPKTTKLFLAGLFLGLSSITHGPAATFLPFALFWAVIVLVRKGSSAACLAKSCLSLVIGFLLVISITTVRNLVVGKDLVLVSSNAGINFFIGNNPDYDKTTSIRPGIEWEELIQRPMQNGYERPSERSRYFRKQAFSYITGQPLSYLKLLFKKLFLIMDGYEIKRNQDPYIFRNFSFPLKLLLWKWLIYFPFGLLLPLSLIGMVIFFGDRSASEDKDLKPILILYFLLAQAVALLFFFICARYRLPLVPLLVILAGFALYRLYQKLRTKMSKEIFVLLPMFLIFVIASNLSRHELTAANLAEEHYNLGMVYDRQEKFDRAIQEYNKAIELQPDHVMAHFRMALVYQNQGVIEKAEEKYLEVIELFPRAALAYNNLGLIYEGRKDLSNAEKLYIKARDAHPLLPDPLYNLASLFARQGRHQLAKETYENCLAVDPSYHKAYNGLGELHYSRGEIGQAIAYLEDALRLEPGYAVAHNNLGAAYIKKGQWQMAFMEFETATKLDPDYGSAHLNLGNWYLEQRNPQKAIAYYERAVELMPDDPRAHYYLALAYGITGREKEANAELNRALSADSSFLPAKELLQKTKGH